jgi:uncharacterized membrane protein
MEITDRMTFFTSIIAIIGYIGLVIMISHNEFKARTFKLNNLCIYAIILLILIGAILMLAVGTLIYSTDVLSKLMYSLDDEDIFKLSVFCDMLSIWDIGLAGKIYRNHFKPHKYDLSERKSERHWKWGAIVTILIQFFIAYLYKDVFIVLINFLK